MSKEIFVAFATPVSYTHLREMLRIENLCRLVGFDERQTATLVKGKPLEYAGELYSEEHGRKFTTEKAGFQPANWINNNGRFHPFLPSV